MPPTGADRRLGVHIAAGLAYLAAVDPQDVFVPVVPNTQGLAPALPQPQGLRQYEQTFRAEFRRLRIAVIGVARPLRYNAWSYNEAFLRVSMETAIILAAEAEGVPYESVELNGALQTCGIPRPPPRTKFPLHAAAHLQPRHAAAAVGAHWRERSVALLVALALRLGGTP